jgi:hypothetical protein
LLSGVCARHLVSLSSPLQKWFDTKTGMDTLTV